MVLGGTEFEYPSPSGRDFPGPMVQLLERGMSDQISALGPGWFDEW
jgi:hypothetical protein